MIGRDKTFTISAESTLKICYDQSGSSGDEIECVIGFTNRGYACGEVVETARAESHGALPMVVYPTEYECAKRKNCMTPWDVQIRQIFTADGSWMTLYAGQGGGKGYVLYQRDER